MSARSTVNFTIYGFAVPEGRPRSTILNGHVHTYKPEKSRNWQSTVAQVAQTHRPPQLLDGALSLELWFYLPRPKSKPKRVEFPITKPDLDNFVKSVKDGMNGVIYTDDSRIVTLIAHKRYDSANPRVDVVVKALEREEVSG